MELGGIVELLNFSKSSEKNLLSQGDCVFRERKMLSVKRVADAFSFLP